jgi:hypothetical protein
MFQARLVANAAFSSSCTEKERRRHPTLGHKIAQENRWRYICHAGVEKLYRDTSMDA